MRCNLRLDADGLKTAPAGQAQRYLFLLMRLITDVIRVSKDCRIRS